MGTNYRSNIDIIKIAGLSGILLPISFFIVIGLSIYYSPWFRWTEFALSDLGITGISSILFNVGLIIMGIIMFMFSVGLLQILSDGRGAYVLVFSSFALIGIGLFPIPTGILHFCISVTFFISLILGFLIIGLTSKKDPFERKMATLAVIISFTSIFFSLSSLILQNGLAIPETIVLLPTIIWCMLYGIYMTFYYNITKSANRPAIAG